MLFTVVLLQIWLYCLTRKILDFPFFHRKFPSQVVIPFLAYSGDEKNINGVQSLLHIISELSVL